jgi:hypothetical protein
MTTTALPLSAGLIIISSLSCISIRADLSACVKLSVLGTCTSTLKPLNSAESSLLSKGLNFCPNPPKINVCKLDEKLDQFVRRLRIKEYFHSKKETSQDLSTDESDIKEAIDIPRFVKKGNWIPKPSKNTRLESVIDLIKTDIKHNVDVHVPKTDNLTQAE